MLVDTKIVAEMLRSKANELIERRCYHLEHNAIMGGPSHDDLRYRADALEDMAAAFESLELPSLILEDE